TPTGPTSTSTPIAAPGVSWRRGRSVQGHRRHRHLSAFVITNELQEREQIALACLGGRRYGCSRIGGMPGRGPTHVESPYLRTTTATRGTTLLHIQRFESDAARHDHNHNRLGKNRRATAADTDWWNGTGFQTTVVSHGDRRVARAPGCGGGDSDGRAVTTP